MIKNLYFKTEYGRENMAKVFILKWALVLSSFPTLLLEVFIRRNFGERYFTMFSALVAVLVLLLMPYIFASISDFFQVIHPPAQHDLTRDFLSPSQSVILENSQNGFWKHYATWYIFTAAFLVFAFVRRAEIKRSSSTFDFAKYSLFRGNINPFFTTSLKWNNKPFPTRIIETILEPLPFFLAGIILWFTGQYVGMLLIICSLFYGLGYEASYVSGDNFILEKIDEMICNKQLEKAFVSDAGADETEGFQMRCKKPEDIDNRRKLLPMMMVEDEVSEAS